MLIRLMSYICIFILCVFIEGCAKKVEILPSEFNDFKIVSLKNHEEITYDDFINRLLKYDIILLGEEHINTYHHIMQSKIIQDLSNNLNLDIALEMFSSSHQDILDEAKHNFENISKSMLKKSLMWDDKWQYSYYKTLMQTIFYLPNTNILGANLNKNEISTIYKGAMALMGNLSTKKEVKDKIGDFIKPTHDISDEDILNKLIKIQQYKDRRMADILVHSKNKIVLIAGRYHVNKLSGVPLHIMDYKSKKNFVSVGLGFENETIKDIKNNEFDFMIFFNDYKERREVK
ncbi:chain X [Campylobacter sputorum subsp. bubulus]|uniref:Chain X n=1 Tax=Campylobacter sputorum subsp. sputorum TaxID=32024 RepID=A0A381DKD2_9BACT|nr:ChaN family lipoprotein [Campylobacter sputorum]ASM34399.1 putative iron-regulated protein, PhuW family [Campylobacter sputorum aubsp. sputorum RM3237]KAB0582211.1 chain X [Campylobacter sputorum subsp. sputorum]QEL04590.1 putative iron-regulated protein, PhuW family [Campylobacter sputorum subsp. sputorum]SUX09368.1 chain X [Campylobacter sputorum subsp. bubulus]SUX11060.1 chain X [Campylobacter sputorum subsp. sputorum]